MVGIYLSGTGNTERCIDKLIHLLGGTAQAIPIEKAEAAEGLSQHNFIVLAYPVQFSNTPVMVRNFIKRHSDLWKGKQALCVTTSGLLEKSFPEPCPVPDNWQKRVAIGCKIWYTADYFHNLS